MWFGLPYHIEMLILEYDSTYKEIYERNLDFLNNSIMLYKQISLTYDNVHVLDKLKFLQYHREFYRFVLLRAKKQTKIQR